MLEDGTFLDSGYRTPYRFEELIVRGALTIGKTGR
jgi:hypothetical protein